MVSLAVVGRNGVLGPSFPEYVFDSIQYLQFKINGKEENREFKNKEY